MTRRNRRFMVWTASVLSLGVILGVGLTWWLSLPPSVTPPGQHFGLAEDHAELAAPIVAESIPFEITDEEGRRVVQDNRKANVRLWESAIKVTGGHLPNYPQQVGDCVSHATKNAIEMLTCVRIARDGPAAGEFMPIATYYIYGISRVQIGKGKLRGRDGSVGAWAKRGCEQYGLFSLLDEGAPAYSGTVARQMGDKGPPQQFIDIASARLVRQASPVTSALDGMNAVCNGYPFIVCSDAGYGDVNNRARQTISPRDGRQVGRRSSRWMHAMCCIGYDGSGPTAYFYLINSWGVKAHADPLQGEPPGGFWVTWDDMEYITRQGDSWAFSDFAGFPARPIEVDVFGARPERPVPDKRTVAEARKTSLAF